MKKQDFIVSSWLATMGCGLPGAIAASLAEPDRQSIAICGDGGFSMVMQDLPTAVKYKLPITVVILNNENLGMIEYEQRVKGNIDYVTQPQNMDYAAFAESRGAKGIKVTKHEELAPAFHEALNSNEPVVIDAVIGDEPPLPGKITYGQAKGFSKYMLKNFFENQKIEMPSLKKSLKRLF